MITNMVMAKKQADVVTGLKQHKTFVTLSICISFCWLWVALQSFKNYWAIQLVNQETPDYTLLINTIDPLYSEALFFAGLGYVGNKGMGAEEQKIDQSIERVFSDVAWRRPASPVAWMELAEWSAQNGFVENAIVYAESAYLLLDNKPSLAWELFDLFVYLGNRQRALSVASLYAINIPSNVDEVLLKIREENISNDEITTALLDRIDSPAITADLMHANTNGLMLKLIQLEELDIAKDIWSHMTSNEGVFSSLVVESFMKLLKKNADFLMMQSVMAHIKQWQGYNVISPLLEKNINNQSGSSCWRILDSKQQFNWSLDSTEKVSENTSLKLDFIENSNLNLYHIFCEYLTRSKSATMIVSGYWKGENVTSDQGVFVSIHDADNKVLGTLTKKTGSWDWQRFDIIVPAPSDVGLNKLVIRRMPSKNLDNKLSGSVWFSEFNIN